MPTLVDRLLDPRVAPALVQDLAALVGTTVAARKGFMGVAVRGAYAAATRLKPNFVPAMIARLLPHWVVRLEPLYAEYQRAPDGFPEKYMQMLSAGGTLRHKDLLAPFGLDASDPEFWGRGLSVIEGFIDELEQM